MDAYIMKNACSAIFVLAAATVLSSTAWADGYPAVPLVSTTKTVMGEDIVYPASGQPQVNAMVLTLVPGEKTMLHTHGVPLFAYVLEGEITVEYSGRGSRTFKKGEAFVEAMHVEHAGINLTEKPLKILAVYMGAVGSEDVIPVK